MDQLIRWRFPLVLRSRYEREQRLWERVIAEQAERIALLEAERRRVVRNLGMMGIGYPAQEAETPEEVKAEAVKNVLPMRPSVIMRRMDRLAEERYLRKAHPSRANGEAVEMLEKLPQGR